VYVTGRFPIAAQALQRIGELYEIERDIRGHSPAERREARQGRSAPVLEGLVPG